MYFDTSVKLVEPSDYFYFILKKETKSHFSDRFSLFHRI